MFSYRNQRGLNRRICVRYDWWRRLQQTSLVSPVCSLWDITLHDGYTYFDDNLLAVAQIRCRKKVVATVHFFHGSQWVKPTRNPSAFLLCFLFHLLWCDCDVQFFLIGLIISLTTGVTYLFLGIPLVNICGCEQQRNCNQTHPRQISWCIALMWPAFALPYLFQNNLADKWIGTTLCASRFATMVALANMRQ